MVDEQKTILVVEDELDTAEMFMEMLRLSGFQVFKCHGGEAAIELITSKEPDAVILDVMIPKVSGLDVLRFIRSNPQLKDTPVVVVSAKGTSTDIKDGFEAGANVYLTKPVGYLDLMKAVEKVLQPQEGNISKD